MAPHQRTRRGGTLLSEALEEILRLRRRWLKQEAGWQPIDSAPRDGTRILLFHSGIAGSGRWAGYFKEGWFNDRDIRVCPTHWTPLPESPIEINGEASST
jgi:hypothetical protein